MRSILLPLAGVLTLPTLLAAQSFAGDVSGHAGAPVARAVPAEAPIRVDGRLDEVAWQAAPVVSDFTQLDPEEGRPASERTEVRILYTAEALYLGVRLFDRHPVTTRLGRRDMPMEKSDWFTVILDSYHDHQTGFGFEVNPSGVRRDQTRAGDREDDSWDPVWDVATSIDAEGWSAELRIPFSQLRFSREEVQTWGIQLERTISRNGEFSVFSFTPRRERGGIARFGHLEGLRSIPAGKRLEILPYSVARAEHVDRGLNPYRTSTEYGSTAGLDLKYRVSSNVTLDATVNPDFGQVEVDPAVINLGVYETFFQEKRPFFVEGSEIFAFPSGGGGQLFYTRRIGRTPQVAPSTALRDLPESTRILGAAKLSGKTANGWSFGVMEAVTGHVEARFRDAQGIDHRMTAEPLTNYFVGRARREARAGASSVGGIVTALHRDLSAPETSLLLHSAAYTGGMDFRHEWANRAWLLRGSLALSHVLGEPEAITRTQRLANHFFQRPDAHHLSVDSSATSLTGLSSNLALRRQAGEHWRGEVAVGTTTPGYEVNDVGFNYRTDRRDGQAEVTYVQNRPGTFWRNWSLTGRTRAEFNTANQLIANWNTVQANLRHLSFWSVTMQGVYRARANDDRLTRGGPLAVRPANLNGWINFSSDPRQPLSYQAFVQGQRDEFGGWEAEASPTLRMRTSPRWNLSVGPRLYRAHTVAQYVTTLPDPGALATFGRRYLFAELEQTELGLETRLNYSFTPRLTLETYVQPLLSSGDYGEPKSLAAPATFDFLPFHGPVPDRDFNLRSLRGNAVLRWEYRSGSTLFVAWQQSRQSFEPLGDFSLDRDRRALFAAAPDNILMVKVNYWLNP
jgi:hypothetical protein